MPFDGHFPWTPDSQSAPRRSPNNLRAATSLSRVYNNFGNIASETRVIGGKTYTISYSYDLANRLTEIIYPSGRYVDYTYDSSGYLTTRFTAELFVDGKSRRRCKIWIQNDEIAFSETPSGWGINDNSYNEIFSLVQDELALRALMGMAWGKEGEGLDLNHLTPEDAAEFLWRRFAARLN
jgi:YD repeat-containing protein